MVWSEVEDSPHKPDGAADGADWLEGSKARALARISLSRVENLVKFTS